MLSFSQNRQVKPTAWKCQLEVTSDLKIPICGYSKVRIRLGMISVYSPIYAVLSCQCISEFNVSTQNQI